jgi:hypothetical protein
MKSELVTISISPKIWLTVHPDESNTLYISSSTISSKAYGSCNRSSHIATPIIFWKRSRSATGAPKQKSSTLGLVNATAIVASLLEVLVRPGIPGPCCPLIFSTNPGLSHEKFA